MLGIAQGTLEPLSPVTPLGCLLGNYQTHFTQEWLGPRWANSFKATQVASGRVMIQIKHKGVLK